MENKGISYEANIRYLVDKSNKRAWFIAFISTFVTVIAIVAVMLLTPLKTVVPYLIKVDQSTGMVEMMTVLNRKDIGKDEALDKYFLATYINAREGYIYQLLNHDYVLTQLMSSKEVASKYRALYAGANARDSVLTNDNVIDVKILSIVLGNSNGINTATIRMQLNQKNLTSGAVVSSVKVATLTYDYFVDEASSEENRIENPLGFKVTKYRVDSEIVRKKP